MRLCEATFDRKAQIFFSVPNGKNDRDQGGRIIAAPACDVLVVAIAIGIGSNLSTGQSLRAFRLQPSPKATQLTKIDDIRIASLDVCQKIFLDIIENSRAAQPRGNRYSFSH